MKAPRFCLRATSVARRSARAARRVQGRRARARRRPEPRSDDELPASRRRKFSSTSTASRVLRNQGREESPPHQRARAPRRDRALGRDCAPSAAYRSGDAAHRAPGDPQPRHLRRELRAGGSRRGAARLCARARCDLHRRRKEGRAPHRRPGFLQGPLRHRPQGGRAPGRRGIPARETRLRLGVRELARRHGDYAMVGVARTDRHRGRNSPTCASCSSA